MSLENKGFTVFQMEKNGGRVESQPVLLNMRISRSEEPGQRDKGYYLY